MVAIGNDISRARDQERAENSRVQEITYLKITLTPIIFVSTYPRVPSKYLRKEDGSKGMVNSPFSARVYYRY